MKHLPYVRLLALCLCLALPLAGLLAGCSKKEEAPSSAPASSSQAAVQPTQPEGPDSSASSEPVEELAPLTSLEDPLSHCLSWGPGTAGSSLKSVLAAVELLNWAEENTLALRDAAEVDQHFAAWYDALSAEEQENFSEVWPIVQAQADALLSGEGDMAPLLEDAGLDPASLPDYTPEHWEVLRDLITARVPLGGEA